MCAASNPGGVKPTPADRLDAQLAAEQRSMILGLRRIRIERGLAISEVAARMNVNPAQVSRFESGSTNPTMATIRRYASAVGATFHVETHPWIDPDTNPPPSAERTVAVSRYPQLRFICWQLGEDAELAEQEALSRYERDWRHVDTASLSDDERAFIDYLAQTYGAGKLLV